MLTFTLILLHVYSYEITISKYGTQCLGEDVTVDTLIVSNFKVRENSPSHFVLSIIDPVFQLVYNSQKVKQDKFSFIATTTGPYNFCVNNVGQNSIVVEFDILSGVAAKDYSDLPQAKDIKESEKKTLKVKEAIIELQAELSAIKLRDVEMTQTNETIGNRVVSYSVLTMVMLVVLAAVQTLYLKRFLKNKKMI